MRSAVVSPASTAQHSGVRPMWSRGLVPAPRTQQRRMNLSHRSHTHQCSAAPRPVAPVEVEVGRAAQQERGTPACRLRTAHMSGVRRAESTEFASIGRLLTVSPGSRNRATSATLPAAAALTIASDWRPLSEREVDDLRRVGAPPPRLVGILAVGRLLAVGGRVRVKVLGDLVVGRRLVVLHVRPTARGTFVGAAAQKWR